MGELGVVAPGLPWGGNGGGMSIKWAEGFLSSTSSHFLHTNGSRSSSLEWGLVLQGGMWGCLSMGGIPFRVRALSWS